MRKVALSQRELAALMAAADPKRRVRGDVLSEISLRWNGYIVRGLRFDGECAVNADNKRIEVPVLGPRIDSLLKYGKPFGVQTSRGKILWTIEFFAGDHSTLVDIISQGGGPVMIWDGRTVVRTPIRADGPADIEAPYDALFRDEISVLVRRLLKGESFTICTGTDDMVAMERWSIEGAAAEANTPPDKNDKG